VGTPQSIARSNGSDRLCALIEAIVLRSELSTQLSPHPARRI
jgi:hypothetical protein